MLVPAAVAVLLLGGLGWYWSTSLVPSTYSVMEMGHVEYGGGAAHEHGPGRSVADLTGPADGEPDVAVDLAAREESFDLASGERIQGFTLNGESPGPALEAHQGDLVEVTLTNVDVPDGVTLHWHGVDVPNAEDGVAGVTQDAVLLGQEHVYRFLAEDAGTYWYHSHQVSHAQVRGGLFGTLVVLPPGMDDEQDVVAAVHTYSGRRTLGGSTGITSFDAPMGTPVRVRVVNTDNGPLRTWVSGGPFRVAAVDGRELNGPTDVVDEGVLVTAGGRADLLVTSPARVDVGAGTALVVGPPGEVVEASPEPDRRVDLLTYGTPAPLSFDPERADRSFEYRIGRRPGLLDGKPGFWWTINGNLFPDVPMFHVSEGDVVRMTIVNGSGDVHPMHLHGHHAVVLSRDGVPSTGSPWWVDSLNVADGETYEIAFLADNPGIWMDHCHNLEHARDGLVAHLAYAGVTEPYRVGGTADNAPE
ncbi:multicopper oxidase family protein [Blastococcus sp. CT_GayMR16]|uniref:multicopper oxidase family protein n=1 Tax=Blastococcus sp. CT_GayMR16 TaxID=2559607 RepID=UPI001ADDDA9F|nr:multicopper oxidase family protein [Blastococcus sp. CT_GayMR16]